MRKTTFILTAIFSLPTFAQEVLLKEVEVKGKRETFKESLEIREVRESFAKDVGEALTKIEGLHKFRKGGIANDVIIRAFQRDNLNVIIDDSEVHAACPNRMDPPAFHVDFSEVEKIEVIKGPFDIRHQGSLGGLVNIITKKPDFGFRFKLNLSLGSFDFRNISPVISYRDDRFYGLAGYSYKYSKPYKDGDGKRITEYANYKPQYINSKAFEINTIINIPYLTSSTSTTFPLSLRTLFLLLFAHHTFPLTLLIFCVLALFTLAMSTIVPSITSSIFLPYKSLAKIISLSL